VINNTTGLRTTTLLHARRKLFFAESMQSYLAASRWNSAALHPDINVACPQVR
jgi:hypothetical protein